MTLRLSEYVVDALAAKLTTNLPIEVVAVNTEFGTDNIEIEPPVEILDYWPELESIRYFPVVGILHGPGNLEDDTGWSATGVYELSVIAVLQEADMQKLSRKLRRYQAAISRAVLGTDRRIGTGTGAAWGVKVKTFDYGPTLRDKETEHTWVSWVELVIEVRIDED